VTLPLFPVTTVGSWPRPQELLRAFSLKHRRELERREFDQVADRAVIAALRAQEQAGADLVTDGEQRRDNFYSFVADKLEGVQMMTLSEMLDIVEDKQGFARLLATLDVPAFSIRNPTCVGPVRRREPLALDDFEFLRRHTDRPIKVTLPGPYLLTRAMWVKEVSRVVYPTKEDLGEDVVRMLREEIVELSQAGVAFIQLDEPVLTELVFTQGNTRTFMCAALAARKDPAEELAFAVSLINRGHQADRRPACVPWQLEPGRNDPTSRLVPTARSIFPADQRRPARPRICDGTGWGFRAGRRQVDRPRRCQPAEPARGVARGDRRPGQ
jgi:5-methyltetrahydropteroyltriglutamate--homocysteine methyltransferase